jgi:methyltransferase-like protein
VFIHDDLDEGSTPFFLYQVVEAAAGHGLQYLADSDFPILGLHGRSDDICKMLSPLPEAELVVREQYLDFIDGRSFRTSLFCHKDVNLKRPADRAAIRRMHLSGALAPAVPDVDPAAADVAVFTAPSGATLKTNQPLAKAALLIMARKQPQAVAFDDLVIQAFSLLGDAAPAREETEIDALSNMLFEAVRTGLIEAYFEPPRLTASVSERPKASALARWQVAQGSSLVTNLLHGAVQCEDATLRRFIPLVDGTRTTDELRAALEQALAREPDAVPDRPVTTDAVRRSLDVMARLALLES